MLVWVSAFVDQIHKDLFFTEHNAQIYSLTPVPQISPFLLGDPIISSKLNSFTTVLSFIQILYLKQQNNEMLFGAFAV